MGRGDNFIPMKSIETKFRGITFRSRLEARWAVFMNALGVMFDYEPEGYDLDGLFYLPDFWLPKQKVFLEIKPEEPSDEELEKARRLSELSKRAVLISFGQPRVPDFDHQDSMQSITSGGWDSGYWWCECQTCGALDIEFNGRSHRIRCHCDKGGSDKGYNFDSPKLIRAYEIAQQQVFWSPRAASCRS